MIQLQVKMTDCVNDMVVEIVHDVETANWTKVKNAMITTNTMVMVAIASVKWKNEEYHTVAIVS